MDQLIEHCEEIIGIADNVVIHDKDDAEHDRCLYYFKKVTQEHGLVFN